jgi:hypothetical protein
MTTIPCSVLDRSHDRAFGTHARVIIGSGRSSTCSAPDGVEMGGDNDCLDVSITHNSRSQNITHRKPRRFRGFSQSLMVANSCA